MVERSGVPTFRLLVGLGNPGREYQDTRHNVGFMVLDRLAHVAETELRSERAWHAEVGRAGEVFLCKPLTYMNRSGESVRPLSSFYKIPPDQVLVVLDDMALPLGKLRFRPGGSAGGHNGLQSIIDHFRTSAIARLRVGIGDKQQPGDAVGHVLGRFAAEEEPLLKDTLARAVEAVQCAQTSGLQAAMNAYN
ncbi:MAG: aminoacyl-tRNA hydrolase [Chthoniobacteraceae bacterium]